MSNVAKQKNDQIIFEKILMRGNEAIGKGAIRAGCRFFFGYPITPQNELFEYMAQMLPQVGGTLSMRLRNLSSTASCASRSLSSSDRPAW